MSRYSYRTCKDCGCKGPLYVDAVYKDDTPPIIEKSELHGRPGKYCPVPFEVLHLRSYAVVYAIPTRIEDSDVFERCHLVCDICDIIWKRYTNFTITAGDAGMLNLHWKCHCEDEQACDTMQVPANMKFQYVS